MSFQKTNLDVSITVWNDQRQQWEKANLESGEAQQILAAIAPIKKNNAIGNALNNEGTVLEITGKRILSKQGEGQFVDLTPDTGWFGPKIDKQIRTQLTSVVRTVKHLTQSRIGTSTQIAIDQEQAKKEGGVVIEVRVGPQSQNQYNVGYEAEYNHFLAIDKAVNELNDERWKKQIPEQQCEVIQTKLNAVHEAQMGITNILNQVDQLLKQNKVEEAVNYYSTYMPQAFGKYCEALREWEPERNLLIELFGTDSNQNPFLFMQQTTNERGQSIVFIRSPETQLHLARYLFNLTKELSEQNVDEIPAMQWLQFHLANLENTKPYAQFCQKEAGKLLKEENLFLQEVDNAINALNDIDVRNELLKMGLKEKSINNYLRRLTNLADQLKIVNDNLADVERFFELGAIREGIELYSQIIQNDLPNYQKALSDLVIPQRVASNKFRDFAPFNLNLNRMEKHQKFCQALKEKQDNLNLTKNNGNEPLFSFDSSLKIIETQDKKSKEVSTFAQLSAHLNDWQKRGENFLIGLERFVDAFQDRREEFEAMMRKEGFTDLQTAAMFNHYISSYEVFEDFYSALQEATDTANRKEYKEALEIVCRVVLEKFPKVNEAIAKGLLYAKQIQNDPRIQGVLKEFLGGKESGKIKACLEFERLAGMFNLDFQGFNDDMRKGDIEAPENYKAASNLVAQKSLDNNRFIDRERRLSSQAYGFINFFNFSAIGKDSTLAPLWNQILKEEKWTFEEAKAFTKLYNDYAALIMPLQEGERAIAQEQDPIKKRAMKAQLTKLATKLAPKIGKLGEQFKKLGGYERLESLSRAASKLAERVEGDKLVDKVRVLFENNKIGYEKLKQQMPFASADDLIKNIENVSKVPRSEQEQKIFEQTWGDALALVQQLKIVEGIQGEAASLQQLMNDRRSYIRDFGIRHHLYVPWEDKVVGRTLLSGPHTSDKIFGQKMTAQGWTPKKIAKLSHWYDAYNKAIHPVQLAYAKLAEDPENAILQQGLRETYEKQLGTINKLSEQMNKDKDIGGIQDVKKLEKGVKEYKNYLLGQILEVQKSIETATGESSKNVLESKLLELQVSLAKLDRVDFAETIEKQNAFFLNVSNMMRNKMSWEKSSFWEKSYLNELTDRNSPLANELKNDLPKGLTSSDIKSIQKLYENYRSELEKINELERKLEKEPSNKSVLKQLRNELVERAEALNHLDKKLKALQPKIDLLQSGIDLIKARWEKVLEGFEKIKEFEGHEDVVEMERKAIGNRTIEQAFSMVDQCNRMNIINIIGEKIRFKRDVYRRHVGESGNWRT